MPRLIRRFLVGCIALVFGYLLLHSREPLRTTIGDPWSDANVLSSINYVRDYGFMETKFTDVLDVGPLTLDSYHYTHYPPFAEITYGAIAKYLGVSDIGTFRLFAITFSAIAMWLLYCFVRRLYNEDVALIGTALFASSFIWLSYADSIHQAPIMTLTGFLALWGLVRVLETGQKRHYAALVIGSFLCFFTSYDYWVFVPTGVMFTIYVKRGNPFARGNRHYWMMCAAACVAGIAVKCLTVIAALGWHEFLADLHLQFLERSTSTHDRKFEAPIPTMIRRFTVVFTPLVWVTFGYNLWRTVRAPNLTYIIRDTAMWMAFSGFVFLYVFAELAASQMLASQVMTPFYAIGSALLIVKLLEGTKYARWAAYGWLVAAPVWGFAMMITTPRSNLERDEVAQVNDYMATHDANDYMMSNLMTDGHIQASFERHYWPTLDSDDPVMANWQALATLEETGSDYFHSIIFTTPESRFIDKSLWPLTMPRRMWALTGWPQLFHKKAYRIIREFDKNMTQSLLDAGGKEVLSASNFKLYRVDRATVMENLYKPVPKTTHIDFGSLDSTQYKLLGWNGPFLSPKRGDEPRTTYSTVYGYPRCAHDVRDIPAPGTPPTTNSCRTKLTKIGVLVKDRAEVPQAQVMIKTDKPCDLALTFVFANATSVQMTVGHWSEIRDVEAEQTTQTFVVPASEVNPRGNILVIEDLANVVMPTTNIHTLDVEPRCN